MGFKFLWNLSSDASSVSLPWLILLSFCEFASLSTKTSSCVLFKDSRWPHHPRCVAVSLTHSCAVSPRWTFSACRLSMSVSHVERWQNAGFRIPHHVRSCSQTPSCGLSFNSWWSVLLSARVLNAVVASKKPAGCLTIFENGRSAGRFQTNLVEGHRDSSSYAWWTSMCPPEPFLLPLWFGFQQMEWDGVQLYIGGVLKSDETCRHIFYHLGKPHAPVTVEFVKVSNNNPFIKWNRWVYPLLQDCKPSFTAGPLGSIPSSPPVEVSPALVHILPGKNQAKLRTPRKKEHDYTWWLNHQPN